MTTKTLLEVGKVDGFAFRADIVIDRSDFLAAVKRASTNPRKQAWLTAKITISGTEKPCATRR